MSDGPKTGAAAAGAAPLDFRRNVFRPDLAAESLYGRVSAPRYVEGYPAQVIRASVPLRIRPSPTNGFETEALFGETVTVYENREGWAWVQLDRDRYVGYVPAETLSEEILKPTHKVRALGTFVYPVPDIKSPPIMLLSMNAGLSIAEGDDRFMMLEGGGFVVSRHVTEIGRYAADFVELAERFIGTPYLWGGRSRLGIDCSGLVQSIPRRERRASPRRATPTCSRPSLAPKSRSRTCWTACSAAISFIGRVTSASWRTASPWCTPTPITCRWPPKRCPRRLNASPSWGPRSPP